MHDSTIQATESWPLIDMFWRIDASLIFSQETVGQDLATRKPDIVFVHISSQKRFFNAPYDYIEDYSQNDTFREAWRAYEWVESDEDFALYRRR